MIFSAARLLESVQHQLPAQASGDLCVAFSGGLDSTVLLYALVCALRERGGFRLRAAHVDHQLHERSAEWERHCATTAAQLGVEYVSHRVTVPADGAEGIESAARTARYAALHEVLRPGETLLTAHHADDQMETLLLALTRGAGLNGLAAMPVCQPFGRGWHLRPLLEFSRAELESWAQAEALAWIADPSNDSRDFNRNFLRHEVIPALRSRWPAFARTAGRTAGHIAEGAALLDELARIDLVTAAAGPCLRVDALRSLSAARRRNLLRFWVRSHDARAPSTRKLLALEHDMLAAQDDRLPVVDWDGFEVRRYRGLLYASVASRPESPTAASDWDWTQPLRLPGDLGSLRTESVPDGGLARDRLPQRVTVDFRHGGEALRPAGQEHHRKLKKLLQDADILPWWRNRLPLIRIGDALAAVGDLWIAEEFAAKRGEAGTNIVWDERPQIKAFGQ
ncbi:MAG TPA: tRNA lysidine(34) synthetase TilS [Povalibacter sp.]|nr:tRNA lysidine(34) synthetase TilS [Povalibacter sp.]